MGGRVLPLLPTPPPTISGQWSGLMPSPSATAFPGSPSLARISLCMDALSVLFEKGWREMREACDATGMAQHLGSVHMTLKASLPHVYNLSLFEPNWMAQCLPNILPTSQPLFKLDPQPSLPVPPAASQDPTQNLSPIQVLPNLLWSQQVPSPPRSPWLLEPFFVPHLGFTP